MPATKAQCARPDSRLTSPAETAADTAELLFSALGELHGLAVADSDLLRRASGGMRYIQSVGAYTDLEHELFCIALAELPVADAFVVEASACYAADVAMTAQAQWRRAGFSARRRAMWLAAILRLADELSSRGGARPDGACAVWNDDTLYLEFDGSAIAEDRLARAQSRVAALEAVTGRRVMLASSAARRGAA